MNAERDSPKFSQEVLSGDLYMEVRGRQKELHAKLFPNLTSFGPKKISKKGKAKYTHSNLCSCVFPQYTTEQIITHSKMESKTLVKNRSEVSRNLLITPYSKIFKLTFFM